MTGSTKRRKTLNLPGSRNASIKLKRLPRKDAALLRFLKGTGLKPSHIDTAPNLSSILGKRSSVIDAMRFSQEQTVVDFLKVYDSTPVCDRKQIPFEAVALKARCNFSELLGAIILSFRSVQAQKSAVEAMALHPQIVAAGARVALTDGGVSDRKMLHEATGFLPTHKGTSINFNVGQNGKPDASEDDAAAVETDMEHLFPRTVRKQEEWQADRTRMLEGGN